MAIDIVWIVIGIFNPFFLKYAQILDKIQFEKGKILSLQISPLTVST